MEGNAIKDSVKPKKRCALAALPIRLCVILLVISLLFAVPAARSLSENWYTRKDAEEVVGAFDEFSYPAFAFLGQSYDITVKLLDDTTYKIDSRKLKYVDKEALKAIKPFDTVHILLHPKDGDIIDMRSGDNVVIEYEVATADDVSFMTLNLLFVSFGCLSAAFWVLCIALRKVADKRGYPERTLQAFETVIKPDIRERFLNNKRRVLDTKVISKKNGRRGTVSMCTDDAGLIWAQISPFTKEEYETLLDWISAEPSVSIKANNITNSIFVYDKRDVRYCVCHIESLDHKMNPWWDSKPFIEFTLLNRDEKTREIYENELTRVLELLCVGQHEKEEITEPNGKTTLLTNENITKELFSGDLPAKEEILAEILAEKANEDISINEENARQNENIGKNGVYYTVCEKGYDRDLIRISGISACGGFVPVNRAMYTNISAKIEQTPRTMVVDDYGDDNKIDYVKEGNRFCLVYVDKSDSPDTSDAQNVPYIEFTTVKKDHSKFAAYNEEFLRITELLAEAAGAQKSE